VKTNGFLIVTYCMAILMMTACEKEESVPPYVGTWSVTWDYEDEEGTLGIKDKLLLTADTYSELLQLRYSPTGSWRSYLGMQGSLSASGYKMDILIDRAGFSLMDGQGRPTGNIIYYQKGTQEFLEVASILGLSEVMHVEFSIAGDNMTFLTDHNGDGDFYDDGELTLYTRE